MNSFEIVARMEDSKRLFVSRIRRPLTVERRSSQQSNPERSLGDGIRKKLDARSNNRLLLEWFSAGESAQSTS